MICLSGNSYAFTVFFSTMGGFLISCLVLKYYFARRRARKMSPAQVDLMRLADYFAQNHPDYVQDGQQMVDNVIRLIEVLHKQKSAL
jgi:hypothetical protein